VQARVIAFWSTIFGYAKIRQASLLQPYMMSDMSAREIEREVIRTAIGSDLVDGSLRRHAHALLEQAAEVGRVWKPSS
jgi:hypothetical protein